MKQENKLGYLIFPQKWVLLNKILHSVCFTTFSFTEDCTPLGGILWQHGTCENVDQAGKQQRNSQVEPPFSALENY